MVRTPDDALEAHSDVLILPDCCAAASSVAEPGSGVMELIAACRFGTEASGVGQLSFHEKPHRRTRFLADSSPLLAGSLQTNVLARIKHWKPRFRPRGDYECRKSPIYLVLTNSEMEWSIELAQLELFPPPPISRPLLPRRLFLSRLSIPSPPPRAYRSWQAFARAISRMCYTRLAFKNFVGRHFIPEQTFQHMMSIFIAVLRALKLTFYIAMKLPKPSKAAERGFLPSRSYLRKSIWSSMLYKMISRSRVELWTRNCHKICNLFDTYLQGMI